MWINLLVAYSCFTTIYYVAFANPKNAVAQIFEIFVEIFFGLDIASNFFVEYKDNDTYDFVRSIPKISKRYVFRGPFLIDFVAVFPFAQILNDNILVTKMLRMFRLPRLMKLIDINRFNQLLKSLFENNSQEERIMIQYTVMYGYKIFRLFIIAIIITYFSGCFWYMFSDQL